MTREVLPPGATNPGERMWLSEVDGCDLWMRVVRARPERGRVLYLHGIESHGGWFLLAAARLAERGLSTFMPDRRGSGWNRELTGSRHETLARLLADVEAARAAVGEPLLLVGLSWGGKLALANALERGSGVAGLVLITPGLVPRVDLPVWSKLVAASSLPFGGGVRIGLPIRPEMFTTTARYLEYVTNDPLRRRDASARLLATSRRLDQRIRGATAGLAVPTLLLLAERDRIIDNAATEALVRDVCGSASDVRTYAGATHSIQFDDVDRLVDDIVKFEEQVRC